jgi:probable rRNA maturation factor
MPDSRHRGWLPRHRVARWIRAALDVPAQITVRIVGEAEGRQLNREFRGKDYATNVLTFGYADAPEVVADLVLCAPVVESEAAGSGIGLQDHYAHLLVHGTLHAQGHDHERSRAEARRMESRESELMGVLGFADPYRR